MIARLFISIVILSTFIGASSCESIRPASNGTSGMRATGKVGEILVVCEQGIWDSEIKHHLDSNLTQFIMPYMPDVATFELVHRTPERFVHSFKRTRNTLFITIDPKFKGDKGKIEMRESVWADGQTVIDIIGKDFVQVLETCKKGLGEVHKQFDQAEWMRIMKVFSRDADLLVNAEIKKHFGIQIAMPDGAKILTNRTNFLHVQFPKTSRPLDFGADGVDAGDVNSGVFIYQYDFIDSSQLEKARLLRARDTMLKYNVPYEVEGMFMGTQYVDYIYPEGNEISTANGKIKGYEIRGMYYFLGIGRAGTGGAFWEFHFVNKKTKKVVCVSGYLDAAPTTSWTHPLRDIQAVLRSVEITP